jgi:hypothetical protein
MVDPVGCNHRNDRRESDSTMTERKRTNDETMERLRSDPWLEAFVASRRRRPFAHQRAQDLAAALADRQADERAAAGEWAVDVIDEDDDETEIEVVCGGAGRASSSAPEA